jgi:hypothetical protein
MFFESVTLSAYHYTNYYLISAQKKVYFWFLQALWWILLHTTVLMLPYCNMYLPVAVFLKAFLAISSVTITSSMRLDIFILDQEGRAMFLL